MKLMATWRKRWTQPIAAVLVIVASMLGLAVAAVADNSPDEPKSDSAEAGVIRCDRISYNDDKSAKCYSAGFLDQIMQDTYIRADRRLASVKLESGKLYQYPFAVMTGEKSFTLTDRQRDNLRRYIRAGGFLVASAACNSGTWHDSFKAEMSKAFPGRELTRLATDHPIFHTVYNVTRSRHVRGGARPVHLEAMTIEGRIAIIYSPDGINDTANAGGDCCCCGGNEVKAARQINVNLLAYALTH